MATMTAAEKEEYKRKRAERKAELQAEAQKKVQERNEAYANMSASEQKQYVTQKTQESKQKAATAYSADTYQKVKEENLAQQEAVKKATAGKDSPSQYKRAYETVKFDGNYGQFKNDRSAYAYASRLVDDKQRDAFLTGYTKYTGQNKDISVLRAEANTAFGQSIYTSARKQEMKLNELGTLYDANGLRINLNTASMPTIVQGIRSIADSKKRNAAIATLEKLTKDKGSRFYGQSVDKELLKTYLGNPQFTQESYDDFVESFENVFYPQSGHEAENEEAYLIRKQGIEDSEYTASVKRQLLEALNDSYFNSTGKIPPSKKTQTASEDEAAEADEPTSNGGIMDKVIGALEGWADKVGVKALDPDNAWDPNNPVQNGGTQDSGGGIIEDLKRPYIEKTEEEAEVPKGERALPAFMREPEAEDPTPPPKGWLKNDGLPDMSSATRLASAGRSDSTSPIPRQKEKEVQGPVQRFTSKTYVKDDSDVVRAIRRGYYSELDKADTMRVDEMMKYGTVRQIVGTVTDAGAVADVLGNNRGAENVVRESYGMLGKTAAMVIEAIMGDEFPEELENDALLVLMQQAERAELMEENGVLGGDESMPLLERLLTTDKNAQDAIAGIYTARDELEAQKAQLREQEELETQKLLAEAREAVRRGEYSDEQLALVQKYAPEVKLSDMAKDYRRMELGGLIDDWDYGFFAEEYTPGADKYIRFKDTAVYKNLEANGVIDTVDYRTALNTQMHRVIDDDTRYAMSLGLTLQEYYDRIGGMTEADICQRAATRIAQQGAAMTEEDMQNIAKFGDGVNALEFGSAVGGKATVGLFADFADTLYIGMSEADTVRTAGRMQVEYQNEFGSLLGREFYRRDLERLIDSGTIQESMAKSLRMAMSAASDIYQVGIDPEALGGLRTAGSKARAVVKQLDRFMQENATEGQYEWYNLTAGALRNLEQAAIAIGVGAIAGAAGATASAANSIGFIAGYSIPTWKGYYDDAVLNKNLSGKSAAYIASAKTGVDYYFNIGTYGKIAGQISRKAGLDSLTTKWAEKLVSNAPVAVTKAYAAVKGYVNSHALAKGAATFAGNILSEFGDEFGEGVGENYVDNALVPIFEKAESGAKVTASDVIRAVLVIPSLDIVGAAGDVLASVKEIAITSSLLALGGAFGEGMNTYKSTKAANDVLTGKSSDIGAVVEAIAEDIEDPTFCEQIDAIAEQVREDEAVAIELMTDDGTDGLMEREAAATEQAEAHAEKKEAAAAGMEQAAQTMEAAQAKIDSGTADAADEQMLTDAQEALPKDKTSYEEAEREELAKREEAKRLRTEKYRSAKTAAKTRLAQQDADIAAQMAEMAPSIYESGRKSVQDSIQRKKESLLAQIEAEFGKPVEEQDENLLNTLNAQYSALEDLEAESAEDAEVIKAKAEERLAELAEAKERHVAPEEQELMDTRESLANAQNKQSDLKDVFHALTHDMIYVSETELANIMYETGARNMTEAARALGIKLTRDPQKGVSLTGGYYNDLKDMAPGYFRKEWDLHPEEAIVSMAKERKILKADIDQLKQDEKAATDAYNKKSATARHAAVAELAQEVPEGHALSQFENETAQESDVVMDEAKDAVKGTTHEVHHDNTLKWEAAKRIAQNGLTNTYNELIRKPIGQQFDDAELAAAYECLKILKQNGSVLKSTMLTARLGMSATKTGQSLRMYSLFRRNAAQNAAADAIQMADAWNKKHGKWKSINLATGFDDAQQMSIGETNKQPFMENEVSRSTSDPAMQKLASDVKARSGLDMYWANMPDGIRGFFDRLRGVIVLNQKIGAAQGMFVTAIHEFTHFMESDPQYEAYANSILKAAYGKDYENSRNRLEDEGQIRDSYGERGQELTPELLTKEIVAAATERILLGDEAFMRQLFARGDGGIAARMLAGMDSFMRKQKAAQEGGEAVDRYKLIEAAREKMKSAIANVGVWRAEANADAEAEAKAQFALVNPDSHYDYSKSFAEQIDDFFDGKIPSGDALVLGGTPELYQKIGFSALPMTMNTAHIPDAVNGTRDTEHTLGKALLAQLPELLADPIAIIKSDSKGNEDKSVVVIVKAIINGKPVTAPIYIGSVDNLNGSRVDVNAISTAFRKKNAVTKLLSDAITKDGVYYINKKEAQNLYAGRGIQFPAGFVQDGLIHSIFDAGSPVNRKYLEQTQTKQFGRWFKGSTIKNPDGTPKIMYRGGGEDIAIFDRKKSKSSNLYGRGFYFTEEENQAAVYGEVRPYYLSVKHPLTANGKRKITQSQLRTFLEAVDEDEDYGLENYGYGATVNSVLASLKGKDDFAVLQDINATAIGDFVAAVELFNKVNGSDYDGIITPTETVVFRSTQIKSADKNIGLYDPNNPNVYYSIQTERNVQGAQVQKGAQQTISDPDTYDAITAPEADGEVIMQRQPEGTQTNLLRPDRPVIMAQEVTGDIAMGPQPDGVQQVIEDPEERDANVVSARVMANIDAMNANEEVSYDNPWGLPLNPFQMEQIARFKLEKVKLPGLAYNRATIEQRQLCAILATRQDYRGEGVMSLTQQLEALEQNKKLFGKKVAVVTDADLYYITSQGAIVEASEVDEADIPVDREADQAYARMLDAQANIVPVSMQEKLNAWRYMSMLSSPVTTVKNDSANKIMKHAERVSTMGAAFFDRMAAKRTGSRQVGMTTKSERKAGKEAARKRGRNAFDDTFVAKADTSRSRRYDMGQGRVFQTEWLELGRNLIGFMMDAPDQMAMEAAIVEEMAVMERIGAKIRDEDTGEIREMTEGERYEEAYRRASERFFHADNRMSKLLNELYKTPFFGTVARINIPFNKTTTNVALRLFDYSPLGLAKSILYDGLYAMNHDKGADGVGANFDQYRFAMGMGRGMTGTMATIAGLLLAQAGYLVAGREDEENDKRREVKGNLGEPYSLYIQIGDTKHEIAFTMPSLAGFAIGAGIWQRLQDDASVQEIVGGFLADSGNALFDNSYVSTLNDLLSGYGSTWDKVMNIIPKTGEAMMQQTFSPAVLRAIAKAFDPYARDTSSKNAIMQSINENVLQGWPVFRTMLPKKYDLTGDEMTQHKAYAPGSEWENAALNFIDSMLSPTATYTAKDDAALSELLDLSYRLERDGVSEPTSVLPTYLVSKKSYTLDINKSTAKKFGKDSAMSISLTEDEKREINREYGDLLFNGSGTTLYSDTTGAMVTVQGIRSIIESKAYERMTDEERKKAISDEMALVKRLIQTKVVRRKQKDGEIK